MAGDCFVLFRAPPFSVLAVTGNEMQEFVGKQSTSCHREEVVENGRRGDLLISSRLSESYTSPESIAI